MFNLKRPMHQKLGGKSHTMRKKQLTFAFPAVLSKALKTICCTSESESLDCSAAYAFCDAWSDMHKEDSPIIKPRRDPTKLAGYSSLSKFANSLLPAALLRSKLTSGELLCEVWKSFEVEHWVWHLASFCWTLCIIKFPKFTISWAFAYIKAWAWLLYAKETDEILIQIASKASKVLLLQTLVLQTHRSHPNYSHIHKPQTSQKPYSVAHHTSVYLHNHSLFCNMALCHLAMCNLSSHSVHQYFR